MRMLLLILIYFVLCPIAGHFLGLAMIRAALAGQQPSLLVIYAVRIVAMLLAYLIVGPILKSLLVPKRAS
jgi:multisubunit Na+/H+ antiporter MnhG subunit